MRTQKNKWTVPIQSSAGDVSEETVEAFWSPDFELTIESVEHAAASQARWRHYKQSGGASKMGFAVTGPPVLVTA